VLRDDRMSAPTEPGRITRCAEEGAVRPVVGATPGLVDKDKLRWCSVVGDQLSVPPYNYSNRHIPYTG
jgi:hypothetical protein